MMHTPYFNGFKHDAQCDLLSERLEVPHIRLSDMVAREIDSRTPLGDKLQRHRATGADYWPVDPISSIVAARVAEPDAAKGFVLNGYPHTVDHAVALDTTLHGLGARLDRVLRFVVPEDVIIEQTLALSTRWTAAEIREEIRRHQENAAAIFDHYADRAIEIDDVGDPREVHARTLASIGL